MLSLCCKSKPKETPESVQPVSSQQTIITEGYPVEHSTAEKYEDGDYCATVEYYNSSTGNSSTYTLEVEIESGELVRINWPNGGWLDSSHFSPPEIDTDGSCSFSTYDGKDYDVQIDGNGGCNISYSSPEDESEEEETESIESEETEENELEETSSNIVGRQIINSFLNELKYYNDCKFKIFESRSTITQPLDQFKSWLKKQY